jgi:hypothetical protein
VRRVVSAAVSILAPPEPPRLDDPELLIREARERQRRRRIRGAIALVALGTAAAVAYGVHRATGGGSSEGRSPLTPLVDPRAFAGDGRLAFVSRGRLWLLDGSAGTLVRVAGAGASRPTFSPNGHWLAWMQGTKRIGVARSDGTGERTLASRGFAPRWLPDDRLLVGRSLFRIEPGLVTRAGTAPGGLVSWLPDGSRYAFTEQRVLGRDRDGSFQKVELVEVARSLHGPRTVWYEAPSRFATRSGYRGNGIADVALLPRGGILVWLDPMHSASLAADGMPVVEIRSPRARPRRLGVTVGTPLSAAAGSIALGAGADRIAWTTKQVVTCTRGRCARPAAAAGRLTVDPALSPDGRTLAFVSAADLGVQVSTMQPTLRRWYATRRLWVGKRELPGPAGAAAPTWSLNGKSLLFVAGDALWLLPTLDAKPVRVAGPLLWPHGAWPNFYGQIGWSAQFAWDS